jgi:hypothetical protein
VRRLLIDRLTSEQLDALAEVAEVVVAALDAEEPDGCG